MILICNSIVLLTMQNFFFGIAKKINNTFLVISNKISIDTYLNEKFCWANQIFVDSTKRFPGCISGHRNCAALILPIVGHTVFLFRNTKKNSYYSIVKDSNYLKCFYIENWMNQNKMDILCYFY